MKRKIANRNNAKLSTGPKTVAGKSRSRLNATKTGLFSQALPVPDADRPFYEKLREDLRHELTPKTTAQQIAFDNIIDCAWRRVLALRLESKRVTAQLADDDVSHSEDREEGNTSHSRWFAASRSDLRNSIRALSKIEDQLQESGYLTEADKDLIARRFGNNVLEMVDTWPKPVSRSVLLCAEMLAGHEEMYNLPLPKNKDKDDAEPEPVVDPWREVEMKMKLLTEQRHFLEALLRFSEQTWVQNQVGGNVDFNPRYFASATKDLQRAFDFYFDLKKRQV